MKKTTIRFEVETADKIEQLGSLAGIVSHFTDTYYHVREAFSQHLKQVFSEKELKLILDAANGLGYSPQMIAGYQGHLENAIARYGLDKKWGVDAETLLAKIDEMAGHELMMLHEWGWWFWYGKWKQQPLFREYVK